MWRLYLPLTFQNVKSRQICAGSFVSSSCTRVLKQLDLTETGFLPNCYNKGEFVIRRVVLWYL